MTEKLEEKIREALHWSGSNTIHECVSDECLHEIKVGHLRNMHYVIKKLLSENKKLKK